LAKKLHWEEICLAEKMIDESAKKNFKEKRHWMFSGTTIICPFYMAFIL
jgi:hypothetical protein